MKKIIGLTLAALLVLGMVASGTLAYFSDTETSSNNVFTAGTLDLGLFNSTNSTSTGSTTGTFSALTFKPGDTSAATLYVNNNGNVAMNTVTFSATYTSVVDGTPTTVDNYNATADTDLLDKMVKISVAEFNNTSVPALVGKSLYDLKNGGSPLAITIGSLPADTEYALELTFTFDSTATNGCQGDSVTFTVTVSGTQN